MTIVGTLRRHARFPSTLVEPRNVDVWLPPGYDTQAGTRFPVIYMHDGQNLFDPKIAFGGVDWGIDEAIARLVKAGATVGAIVVGTWNTEKRRWREYMPQKALDTWAAMARFRRETGGTPLADRYLGFLIQEVKPFVDETYRTLPGRESTFVMGSSMGGLASLYAVCEYPHLFQGAGCLSTHWPSGNGSLEIEVTAQPRFTSSGGSVLSDVSQRYEYPLNPLVASPILSGFSTWAGVHEISIVLSDDHLLCPIKCEVLTKSVIGDGGVVSM